ncbi:MAG: pyridoxal-phosphate dependent enzyme, partial [Chloroflexi bacterium]|nr:pyridoxal-phosphate dependent enzyme [Chloroflexota bacterium]
MQNIPRLKFAHLPTPVEEMPRLSAALGGPTLLVKRDDQTGLAFGGNKTRKLEFLLAEAQAQGARTLITTGAGQSNHCRQTVAAAVRQGFDCILVLTGDPPAAPSANLLLDHLLGAEIVWTAKGARDETLQRVFDQARSAGRRPYLVPYGGSSPMGAAAYAFAMQEMLEQGLSPDWIVFASSSGGTQAGLMAGARLFGFEGKILGISVDEPQDVLRERVARIASGVAGCLRAATTFQSREVLVNADYVG